MNYKYTCPEPGNDETRAYRGLEKTRFHGIIMLRVPAMSDKMIKYFEFRFAKRLVKQTLPSAAKNKNAQC